jgi:hypothetical protein
MHYGNNILTYVNLLTNRLREVSKIIYIVTLALGRTSELGEIPASVFRTLSATSILFQVPLKTSPLYNAISPKELRTMWSDIQPAGPNFFHKINLVLRDNPVFSPNLTSAVRGQVCEAGRDELSLLIHGRLLF